MGNGSRLLAKVVVVLLVSAGVTVFVLRDPHLIRSAKERRKLAQIVPAMSLENRPAGEALEQLVARLPEPMALQVCADLLSRPINVRTNGARSAEAVIQEIGAQLGASVELWGGRHGTLALPRLDCVPHKTALAFVVPTALRRSAVAGPNGPVPGPYDPTPASR